MWTVKKDFLGATAVNAEQTGAIQIREKNDEKYAIFSTKNGAFALSAEEMYMFGQLLMMFGKKTDTSEETVLKWASTVMPRKTPIQLRRVELPVNEHGCIDLQGEHAIEKFIKGEKV